MNIHSTHRPNIFSSVEEMDAAVNNHIYHNADKLSANYRAILKILTSYSLKELGTSHLKYQTISEQVGCSRVTVVRAIKRLKELGIIDVTKGKKLNGIQGADYFHILNFEEQVIMRTTQREMIQRATHETPRSSKAQDTKNNTEALDSFKALSNPSVNKNVNYVTAYGESDLQSKLKSIYQPSTVEGNQAFEELCKIAFGRLKQYMQSHQVPYTQMEQIVLKAMSDLVRKQGVRNQFAMYSKMIERQTLQLFEQHIKPKATTYNFGKKVGVVPEWFEKGEHMDKKEKPLSDAEKQQFEEQRKKLLAELGA